MIFKKLKVAPECLEAWHNLKEEKMKGVIFSFSQNMVSALKNLKNFDLFINSII